MNDLPRIRKIGWLLLTAAAVGLLLTLLISVAGPGGFGFLAWTLLLILTPAALTGLGLLAYHWFKVSKRTGRRL